MGSTTGRSIGASLADCGRFSQPESQPVSDIPGRTPVGGIGSVQYVWKVTISWVPGKDLAPRRSGGYNRGWFDQHGAQLAPRRLRCTHSLLLAP